jgi:DNA-binding transcriptional ArsR family regulator
MGMITKQIENPEWLQVYEFWKEVPTIIEVDSECFATIVSQEFRSAILTILRKGIHDDYTRQHNLPKRHALSAPELRPLLEEKLEQDVLLSNVYFHLEKLEKANLIKKIAKRLEGRHYVTYYGRTCKLIIGGSDEESKSKKYAFFEQSFKLLEALNPAIDKEKLDELVEKIAQRHSELYEIEKAWLEKNHQTLLELDIGVLELYDFMCKTLRPRDPQLQELLTEFYELIGLEIYGPLRMPRS